MAQLIGQRPVGRPKLRYSDRQYSTTTEVIEITIRLRYDYDVSRAPASIRREKKINVSIFRRSRVVVVS